MPTEIADGVRFGFDHAHATYDLEAMHAFSRSLVSAHRVLSRFGAGFTDTSSPVHCFAMEHEDRVG